MQNHYPLRGDGEWYKGNMHTHSTRSDGMHEPLMMAELHRRTGYGFFALTDHRRYTDFSKAKFDDLLILPGAEYNIDAPDEAADGETGHAHVNFYRYDFTSSDNAIPEDLKFTVPEELQKTMTFRQQLRYAADWAHAHGNLCILNHPCWSRHYIETAEGVNNLDGVEIYNTASELGSGTGNAVAYWDHLLRAGARGCWGFASDDCHGHGPDFGGGWVMVKAADYSLQSIMDSIRAGRFYATNGGPHIDDVYVEDGRCHVICGPAVKINMVCYEPRGRAAVAPAGQTINQADFAVSPEAKYIRIEVIDGRGKTSWSQPIFINPPDAPSIADSERRNPRDEIIPIIKNTRIPSLCGDMTERHPIRSGEIQYRGALHVHTTRSDGKLSPDDSVARYRSKGYSFVALTDHDIYTSTTRFDDPGRFITLDGVEAASHLVGSRGPGEDETTRASSIHAGFLRRDYANPGKYADGYNFKYLEDVENEGMRIPTQRNIDTLNANGHMVIINHPNWSTMLPRDVYGYRDLLGIEIWNGETDYSSANGLDTAVWDHCLRNGMRIFGFATDDAHNDYGYGLGWIMVNAAGLTRQDIVDAILAGRFYSSSGPEIYDFSVDDKNIARIKCSPAQTIRFITYPERGVAHHGAGIGITSAQEKIKDSAHYVRAEVVGLDGKTAWTQPVFLR